MQPGAGGPDTFTQFLQEQRLAVGADVETLDLHHLVGREDLRTLGTTHPCGSVGQHGPGTGRGRRGNPTGIRGHGSTGRRTRLRVGLPTGHAAMPDEGRPVDGANLREPVEFIVFNGSRLAAVLCVKPIHRWGIRGEIEASRGQPAYRCAELQRFLAKRRQEKCDAFPPVAQPPPRSSANRHSPLSGRLPPGVPALLRSQAHLLAALLEDAAFLVGQAPQTVLEDFVEDRIDLLGDVLAHRHPALAFREPRHD